MEILKITNSKLKEEYFEIKNKYNLKILLYPMPKFSTTFAAFATHFGSINTTFRKDNNIDYITIPEGTAHYLEHKLFDNEGNSHTFNLFAETGAKANAFTSYNTTAFWFSCTQNFNSSLKILLNFVQNPYFTNESVLKERGIIEQEIQMYDDSPESKVLTNCLKALYKNHPIREDIGGTIESIAKIDANLLQTCYDAFYRLNNMELLIVGNFNIDNILKTIEDNLKHPNNIPNIETKKINEPFEVNQKFIKSDMPVLLTYFSIGFKLQPPKKEEVLEYKLIFDLICELLVGEGSYLFSELYNSNLVSGGLLDYSIEIGDDYFAIIFSGQSNKYDRVAELLTNEIRKTSENGFDKDFFELVKRSAYCQQVVSFNSVEEVANCFLETFTFNRDVFDSIKIISEIDLNKINEYVKKIDLNNNTISIISPKN